MNSNTITVEDLKNNIRTTLHMKRKVTFLKAVRSASIFAIIATVILSFFLAVSPVQGFIIIPVLLLAQMSLVAYADLSLDLLAESNNQAAQVYCFIERYYAKSANSAKARANLNKKAA